ncbi:MAG TPA: histidine--tRNA ligase [Firmicutes bacterium]|nr:histidine--tRNA ligase [Bacillota bacterium]
MLMTAPRGTRDILSPEVEKWQYLEEKIRKHCRRYAFSEIRTPIIEHTELFQRSVGETTDIVQKEMYTFQDRAGRWLTLRPEATASTARAYLENNLFAQPQPVKLYYIGPMFRYDRPQAGRYRQFYQFGVEVIGTQDPAVDTEVILLAVHLFADLGLRDLEVHLNSIGCPQCRGAYRQELRDYLAGHLEELCPDCRARYEQNPLRVLDCKQERCRQVARKAPEFSSYLCEECREHFQLVQGYLRSMDVKYQLNPNLVRGLDYYTKTVFEIVSRELGAQAAICGGGRYDGLVEECGGQPTPGIGFALGMERLLLALDNAGIKLPGREPLDAFLATIGSEAQAPALKLLYQLRQHNLRVDKDYLGRSLKAQLKYADKKEARFVVILGEGELKRNVVLIRKMATGEQEEVPWEQAVEKILAEMGGVADGK